jgi:hypothetical protein
VRAAFIVCVFICLVVAFSVDVGSIATENLKCPSSLRRPVFLFFALQSKLPLGLDIPAVGNWKWKGMHYVVKTACMEGLN